ncbi:MAG: DegT/DnrJ/EryC1/StrS family aminotransferase, partial [Dehalococcoidales bacterium]|nr:DegT/DnrJ/EryC1/StrS family aminotransferase [Dehalococcoidales bacterium]
KAQYHSLRGEIDQAVHRVIESGQFILGEEVETLEREIATFLGVKYAIGVGSGTDALLLALLACGIKPEDEVITTPFTFIATVEAIIQCRARPVFVDIDPHTFNIDPTRIERKITERTKAILPVHLYGQPADMEPILELARKYKLKVIEDCAQSFGARYRGRKVGSFGNAGCLSFFPSKVLGAYGDGGMVVTDNAEVADKLRMLRNHGARQKYYHLIPGFNSRLDEIQAAILRVKLKHIDEWIDRRRQSAELYSRLLGEVAGIKPLYVAPYSFHNFNYYTIRLSDSRIDRNKLREYLTSQGIATAIYYPLSLHLQEVCRSLGYQAGDFPESERAQGEVLSLPMYPELTEDEVEWVVEKIRQSTQEEL